MIDYMITKTDDTDSVNPSLQDDGAKELSIVQVDASSEGLDASSHTLSQKQRRSILIVHASVGSGHRSAAYAIASAFDLLAHGADQEQGEELGSDHVDEGLALSEKLRPELAALDFNDLDVEVLDILDFGRIVFNGDNTASMFTGATRPFYDLTWRYTLTGRLLWGGGTIWARLMYHKFVDYVAEKKPVAIVCTHITAANAAVSARMILHETFPIICVPTDYEVEGLWPHLYTDLFCVSDERMAETLRPRKISEDAIQVTGIPTKPDFDNDYDREASRAAFGLPQDKQIVLFLAGAKLPRPYVHFRKAVHDLIPYVHSFENMHVVIVAGSDEEYAREVRRDVADHKLDNVSVFGYVEEMARLMKAVDVIVCKPGGLTVTECLNANVPMVLLGRAYGQEKANVSMLTSYGAAFHVTTSRELVDLLRQINHYPETTSAILVNASFIRRPRAAIDIAKATLDLAKRAPDHLDRRYKKHFMRFYFGGKPAHIR